MPRRKEIKQKKKKKKRWSRDWIGYTGGAPPPLCRPLSSPRCFFVVLYVLLHFVSLVSFNLDDRCPVDFLLSFLLSFFLSFFLSFPHPVGRHDQARAFQRGFGDRPPSDRIRQAIECQLSPRGGLSRTVLFFVA
ncbi:hypothetical protein HPB50_024211 [Hyalomma asiaticum]|uniref:Uncharacterized protein n=1 Tax=Hyalomma asiaticum TaxID=266040 RepID=A0ACB7SQM7_HYAAI|nr:hypothetical protein HPB50_024211 [Hyalomma asiaticum]